MKTKKPILRLAALAALSFFTGNEIVAQTNIGAACGCPTYANRPVVLITDVASAPITTGTGTGTSQWAVIENAYGKELQNGKITLTCDKTWKLDEKLYIGPGSTITIEPGTVIKGTQFGAGQTLANARALIIERGGKIMAQGVEECPIVFTSLADPLDGSYSVQNKGQWGGILLCGKAPNNLMLATNGPFVPGQSGKMAVGDGLGVLEGFAASIPQDQFGVLTAAVSGTQTAAALTGTYDMFFDAVANGSANGASQNKISITSNTQLNLNIQVGQPIYTGSTLIGYVGEVSTSSPHSSSNPRITLSSSATSLVPVNLPAAIAVGDDVKIVGTYPSILTAGTTYTFNTYTTSSFAYASGTGTGPYVQVGSTTQWINMSSPYNGGTTVGAFDPEDNSGIMTYVSIRHAGANLLVGSEINGLTLASVGRGTKIEHIEIVSCADDNIEIFGGTVNLKYCTTLFGNDDMYDYDLGWTGKAQFLFGMKADVASTVSTDNDNGFECDGGDNSSILNPSNPTIYNATIIGNAKTAGTSDNRGLAAINMKEGARGTINNSVFAGFKNGLNLENGTVGTNNAVHNAFHNWTTETLSPVAYSAQSVKVKCNTFVGVTTPFVLNASVIAATGTAPSTTNLSQFGTTDLNATLTQAEGVTAGFKYAFAINGSTSTGVNDITTLNDVVPNVGVAEFLLASPTTCPQAPQDGFFSFANYRGAFAPSNTNENWLTDWTYSQVLNTTLGIVACPTDINNDGTTDVNDFLIFSGEFGQACN